MYLYLTAALSWAAARGASTSSTQGSAALSNNNTVRIPQEYTYLLPDDFTGNVNYTLLNGTHTPDNSSINALFARADAAPYTIFDDEFLDIIGQNASTPQLIASRPGDDFAYEAGVWVPERNEVWLTTATVQGSTHINVLDLSTNTVSRLNGTSEPVINPNGGYYWRGKVYIGTFPGPRGSNIPPAGVISIDVKTLEVETILNSYFGVPLLGVDDLVWTTAISPEGRNKSYLFLTDLNFAYLAYGVANASKPQLPANVYRFDPDEQTLLPVISRNELNPNGIRVSPDGRTLYVTDGTNTFLPGDPYLPTSGPSDASWLGPYIYAYDLSTSSGGSCWPMNRRLFGMARRGIADGLHVDDAGRVWTAEGDGVVVRRARDGKVLGLFNQDFFLANTSAAATTIANFALAGRTLVVGAVDRMWRVELAQTVVSKDSSIVN